MKITGSVSYEDAQLSNDLVSLIIQESGEVRFFNNQKNAGIALIVLAVVSVVCALITVIYAIVDDGNIAGSIIAAIGSIIAGILYFGFGMRVKGGSSNNVVGDKLGLSGGAIDGKYDVLVEFVHVFAFVSIIEGIFGIIGGIVGDSLGNGIINLIVGVIALYCYKKLTDGKTGTADQVIWVILLILFILTIIAGAITCIGIITIPLGIAMIIIGVFMMMSLLDDDVKKKFGM